VRWFTFTRSPPLESLRLLKTGMATAHPAHGLRLPLLSQRFTWTTAGADPLPNPFQLDGNANGWFYATSGLYTIVVVGSNLAQPLILVDQALLTTSAGGTSFETNGTVNSNQALLNLVQGTNMTISASGGNITFNSSASPITLEVNSSSASSQTLQNLIAGSGITITDGGSGQITFASTGGVSFEVNGTPTSSQSLINFVSGTNVTITNPSAGEVLIASAYPAFQVNSTPLTSSTTINYQQGTGITITNPSAGTVNIALASSFAPVIQSTQTTVSSAQLLLLHTTPVQILPAQGSGTLIVIDSVQFEFDPDTTAYTSVSTADIAVYVDTTQATNFKGDSTGLIDQTAKTFEIVTPSGNKFFTTDTHSDNQPVMIANIGSGNYATGNGTLVVNVNYYLVAVV
jgi:hypothetical protein